MLTPPYTPTPTIVEPTKTTSLAAGGSIFDAATLIVYNIPFQACETAKPALQRLVDIAKAQDPPITADFQIEETLWTPSIHDERTARISLPRAVHEQDPHAFEIVQMLNKRLEEKSIAGQKGMEVEWAPCRSNDRAQSCTYTIKSKEHDVRLRLDSTSRGTGENANKRYRLDILNRAIDQVDGVSRSSHIWLEHGSDGMSDTWLHLTGHIQLASPGQVRRLLRARMKAGLTVAHGGSVYHVHFEPIQYHIRPTSCTTIAAELRDTSMTIADICVELESMVELISNYWQNDNAAVSDIRIENGYILADVATLMGAEAICEIPFVFSQRVDTYFRQVYFMNGNPYNFKIGGLINYRRAREEDREDRLESSDYAPTGRTTEFIVDHRQMQGKDDPVTIADSRLKELQQKARRLFKTLQAKERRHNWALDDSYHTTREELRRIDTLIKKSQDELRDAKAEEEKERAKIVVPIFVIKPKSLATATASIDFPPEPDRKRRHDESENIPSPPMTLEPASKRARTTSNMVLEQVVQSSPNHGRALDEIRELEARRDAHQAKLDKLEGESHKGLEKASLESSINRKNLQIAPIKSRVGARAMTALK